MASEDTTKKFIEFADAVADRPGPYVEEHAARLGIRLDPLWPEVSTGRFVVEKRSESWIGDYWVILDSVWGEEVIPYLEDEENARYVAESLNKWVVQSPIGMMPGW